MYKGMFLKGTDYKTAFEEQVDKLVKKDVEDHVERNAMVEELIDSYVKQTDKTPDRLQLSRLSNWILAEERNNHPDKVTRTEYPIFTGYQMKVRRRREFSNEHVDKFTDSGQHRVSGKKKPTKFKVFGEYS